MIFGTVMRAGNLLPWSQKLETENTFQSNFDGPIGVFRTYPVIVAGKSVPAIEIPRNRVPLGKLDLRDPGIDINFNTKLFKARHPEQNKIINESVKLLLEDQSHILAAPTGYGKCLHPDTPVMLHSGYVKKAREIKTTDTLMGPDGKARNVLNVNWGTGSLYKITPVKGESWICNDAHILSLVRTDTDVIKEVTVSEWLKWSKTHKHVHKLWRTGIDFGEDKPLPIDPYFLGLLLGDGGLTQGVNLTTMDGIIAHEVYVQAEKWNLEVRVSQQEGNKAATYKLSGPMGGNDRNQNKLLLQLQMWGMQNGKHIPHSYKTASREQRLQLLAGLMDTDGSLNGTAVFDYITKEERLADGVLFVARSLGFAAYKSKCQKYCQNGNGGDYWRIGISGATEEIPCRLWWKQASVRKQKKDVLRTGFSIEPIGDGEYVGFVIDGDHLFLLGDFTVTHNTFLGAQIAGLIGKRFCVITTKEDIIDQWVQAIVDTLGLTPEEVGIWRADQVPNFKHKAVVALIQSVMKGPERYGEDAYNGFGLVICDEVHRMGAEGFSQAMWHFPSKLRLGMSATPYRKDGKDKVFLWHIGPVLVEAKMDVLVPKVLIQRTGWQVPKIFHDFGNISLLMKPMVHSVTRNVVIFKYIKACYEKGRSMIVFSDSLEHLEIMAADCLFSGIADHDIGFYVGVPNDFYKPATGKDQKEMRKQHALRPILFSTYKMASEATNLPWLDTCLMCTPRSGVEQIVGRIRREYEDKKQPIVVDFVDQGSNVLGAYAGNREKWYASIGAPIVRYSA